MPLEEYRRKRDFAKTPEPPPADLAPATAGGPGPGGVPPGSRRRFVVQRHRATRLHYDLRFEIDGVLVSWAVPKGPTQDPATRRMAVHVEDHPLEYFDFEGVIPARQYGAGDVIVWDWGTWEPEPETPDPGQAIGAGELKFTAHGTKMKGRFTIVRTSRRPGTAPRAAFEDDEGEQWLLIKKRDAEAEAGWNAEDHPASVRSGRTNDEVKANAPAIWVSEAPAATAEIDLAGARVAPMPRYLEPMLATLATKPFRDEDWLFEVKWDGYRVEAVVRDGKVSLFTRNGHDAETYFPRLLTPPSWIEAREAIVDGEVVALDDDGRPDFGLLQERITRRPVGAAGAARVPGVRPAPPRRAVAARCPARAAQAPPGAGRAAHGPGPGPAVDRDRGRGLLRGRQGTAPRGHRRQAPAEPVRARTSRVDLAQDQGAPGAGAGRRRVDAGSGEREGARRARGRRLRGRAPPVCRQGRIRPRRARAHDAQAAAR